jgi:hypothetical protein
MGRKAALAAVSVVAAKAALRHTGLEGPGSGMRAGTAWPAALHRRKAYLEAAGVAFLEIDISITMW